MWQQTEKASNSCCHRDHHKRYSRRSKRDPQLVALRIEDDPGVECWKLPQFDPCKRIQPEYRSDRTCYIGEFSLQQIGDGRYEQSEKGKQRENGGLPIR